MEIELTALLIRGAERLLILLSGLCALIMGWSLLRSGIMAMQGAEFSGAGFSLKATKASPGIFFSLFGCVILSMGMAKNLELISKEELGKGAKPSGTSDVTNPSIANDTISKTKKMSLFGASEGEDAFIALMQSISTLESQAAYLGADKSASQKSAISNAIINISSWKFRALEERFGQSFYDFRTLPKNWKETVTDKDLFAKYSLIEQSMGFLNQ